MSKGWPASRDADRHFGRVSPGSGPESQEGFLGRGCRVGKNGPRGVWVGCGKGDVYEVNDWDWPMPTLYDPAIPEYEELPDGPFDGVLSTDVMEHIPENQIPEIIDQIFSRAERFVYLGIANNEAEAVLSDGTNAHVTRQSVEWWANQVELHAPKEVYTHIKTYGDSDGYIILNEEIYLEWMLENV